MRTETVTKTYYKFEELPEEAQDKAIERLCNINTDYDWWNSVYDDALNIGLKIEGFDLGGHQKIEGHLTESLQNVCEKILKEHGETCDTHHLAAEYLPKITALQDKFDNLTDEDDDSETSISSRMDELEEEFERALKEEYLSILRKEEEYLTGREAIVEQRATQHTPGMEVEVEANARLMAAAPDLLEALKKAEKALYRLENSNLREELRTLIAKVEGRKPKCSKCSC